MGGVVGGDSGWKLFNEGSSLVEEGVVIFATHQTALVVWTLDNSTNLFLFHNCKLMIF